MAVHMSDDRAALDGSLAEMVKAALLAAAVAAPDGLPVPGRRKRAT
jgi:hypothetical protein